MKLVSLITVNYNHSNVTECLFKSIQQKNVYSNIEVIVVDNASIANPTEEWKVNYPDITFIRSEKNLGFAGGNNLGIRHAKGDYLLLINNDTEITESLVSELVNIMGSNPSIGIVSPKILYYDQPNILQYAGYTEMNFLTGRNKCIGQFEKDTGQYNNQTGKTGYAHGAAMMVSRNVLLKTGLMEDLFFLYYEELDWCERIKKAGYEIWINMQATIYHKESISVGKNSPLKEYYMNRNRILFVRKHTTRLQCVIFLIYFLSFVFPRNILKHLFTKQYILIKPLCKAVVWNFFNKATKAKAIELRISNDSLLTV